jgi:hypothetical protein
VLATDSPLRAASIAGTSILFMVIIASKARLAAASSGLVVALLAAVEVRRRLERGADLAGGKDGGVELRPLAGFAMVEPSARDQRAVGHFVLSSGLDRRCDDRPAPVHASSGPGARALRRKVQSPLTDSNRRPPPYHAVFAAIGRNPRQRFSHVRAVFALPAFATGCHRLRPLCSNSAPRSRVRSGRHIASRAVDGGG